MLTFHTVAQQERPGFLYDGICNQGTRSCSNFIIDLSWSSEPINCSVPCRKHPSLLRQHCLWSLNLYTALPLETTLSKLLSYPPVHFLPFTFILLLILHTSRKLLTCVMQARLLVSREMKNSAFKSITKYFKYTLP